MASGLTPGDRERASFQNRIRELEASNRLLRLVATVLAVAGVVVLLFGGSYLRNRERTFRAQNEENAAQASRGQAEALRQVAGLKNELDAECDAKIKNLERQLAELKKKLSD